VTTPKRKVADPQKNAVVIEAVERAMPILQSTAATSREAFVKHISKQQCASCHQQYLPMAAVGHARTRSIRIDKDAARKQVELLAYFEEDRGQPVFHPEPAHSYGYEAFALAAEKVPAGGSGTDAIVHHLAVIQAADGRWYNNLPRPPLQSSDVAATALAIQALATFGWDARRVEFTAAVERAKKWLWTVQAETNEEAVYQLLGLHWAGEQPEKLAGLTKALVDRQRDDGGWAQLPTLGSDAYATGQALYALNRASQMDSKDRVWQQGVRFLLGSQFDDGSWHASRRAFPFQPTMPSGFPHGRDSWLSASATSWAVMALTQGLPPGTAAGEPVAIKSPLAEPIKSEDKIDFARQIKPLLERSCLACHGAEKPRSAYRIDSRAALLKGGVSGEAAVVPGHGDKSPLLDYVAGRSLGMEMPPLHKRQQYPALSKEDLKTLRAWVEQGAAWPDDVVLESRKATD
jgi:cytochrome c5